MKKEPLLILAIIILISISISLFPRTEITNFQECIDAGNPAMESHPRQCMHDGETFVEVLGWENDGVSMMQDPKTLKYACFGCGKMLCIDPVPTIVIVEETEEFHCDGDFNIIGEKSHCSQESRDVEACITLYEPVCGYNNPEKIQCAKWPCASTYSNSCNACKDEDVIYYEEGECPI